MANKFFNNLLLFSLFGVAMWFFGNLYEAVVLGPNMLDNSVQKMQAWHNFFTLTNPLFYYIPLPQLATILLAVLFFKTPAERMMLKRQLKIATILQVASVLLTAYIIIQINIKLFFGDSAEYSNEISYLAQLWNILNMLRVFIVGMALAFIFKAYILTQKGSS